MKRSVLLAVLFGLLIMMTSCSQPGEVTLSKYFQAMKLNDKDTMAAMAIEPKDVEFKSYEIVALSETQTEEYALPILLKKLQELEVKKTDLGTQALDARDDVEDLKDEQAETRRASRKRELDQEIEAAENKYKGIEYEYKEMVVQINELKKKIDREKNLIKMSTGFTENLEMFEGETQVQKVDVKFTLLNDEVKDYVFLLRSNVLKLEDKVRKGRLIVTLIETAEDYANWLQRQEEKKEAGSADAAVTAEQPTEQKDEGQE